MVATFLFPALIAALGNFVPVFLAVLLTPLVVVVVVIAVMIAVILLEPTVLMAL